MAAIRGIGHPLGETTRVVFAAGGRFIRRRRCNLATGRFRLLHEPTVRHHHRLAGQCGTGRAREVEHRLGDLVYVELEPELPDAADAGTRAPIYSLARHLVPLMQRTSAVDELCRVVVAEMKRLTGFGRCLAYRFDADGHGEVLAEVLDRGYASYAGHHFPAADIPPQARELYRVNHIRLIADAHYEPVPVRFVDGREGTALDMSQSALRSVSPVHLEYMRNMRTRRRVRRGAVGQGGQPVH